MLITNAAVVRSAGPIETDGKHFLTPRLRGQGELRIFIEISADDHERYEREKLADRKGWYIQVTDLLTLKRFHIKSAPCGLGCHCDAIARCLD